MHVKPEFERFAKIRVVGVGGAGGNVINSMIDSQQITGVEFIAINTDAQDLSVNKAFIKLPIGQEITGGLGSGSNPDVGKKAAEESLELIKDNLKGADMIFITAGMGGGTGTGASPTIAKIAKELGALTIGVVTKPFSFEGAQRMRNADEGIQALKKEVDALITIPNQKLLEVADDDLSIIEAFKLSDSVLNQGVQGISDLIVLPGLINVDFADVRTIMRDAGTALMGIGIGAGDDRSSEAAKAAISSPLLEESINGATGILFNVIGGRDLTLREVDKAANIIRSIANPDANIIFGAAIDDRYDGQVKITVIATGFDKEDNSLLLNIPGPTKVISHSSQKTSQPHSYTTPQNQHPVHATDGFQNQPSSNPKFDLMKSYRDQFDATGNSVSQSSEEAPETKKDGEDPDSQYDIPAFLRKK